MAVRKKKMTRKKKPIRTAGLGKVFERLDPNRPKPPIIMNPNTQRQLEQTSPPSVPPRKPVPPSVPERAPLPEEKTSRKKARRRVRRGFA